MRKAAIISALLHVSVFMAAWFGLPVLFRDDPIEPAVRVDVVVMETEPKPEPPKAEPKSAPKPKPAASKPPPPPEPPSVPEPPKMAAVTPPVPPAPEPEPLPVPKAKPKPKPEPPKVEPKPAPKPVAKAPPKPKPKPKPKAKPKPPPDRFDTILKNLAKEKAARDKDADKKETKVANAPPLPKVDRPAPRASSFDTARTSAQLAAMVKQQVTPCWNIPGGAKDAQKMQIAVRIQVNPDGTLRGAPRIEDTARMARDPFYRAMAESAARALRLPSCTPLKLPYDKYDLWKDITLIFDPSEALGP
jgi:hypothetical protein